MYYSKNQVMEELKKYSQRVRDFNWENKDCYASWLSQTYHFVCHSTRLISFAASGFYKDREKEHSRYIKHISEEHFHEKLAEKDLKNLGKSLSDYPELSITKGFYQSQYYQISRLDASAFIGYVIALEGIAVLAGKDVVERTIKTHGKQCATFLKVHAEEDLKHIEDALDQYELLKDEHRKWAYDNFIQSGDLYCEMLDKIESNFTLKNNTNAA